MKCTAIIPNTITDWLNAEIQPLSTLDAWKRCESISTKYPAHGIKVKIGDGSFRDKVELNQILRREECPAMETGKRKGYQLITFNF